MTASTVTDPGALRGYYDVARGRGRGRGMQVRRRRRRRRRSGAAAPVRMGGAAGGDARAHCGPPFVRLCDDAGAAGGDARAHCGRALSLQAAAAAAGDSSRAIALFIPGQGRRRHGGGGGRGCADSLMPLLLLLPPPPISSHPTAAAVRRSPWPFAPHRHALQCLKCGRAGARCTGRWFSGITLRSQRRSRGFNSLPVHHHSPAPPASTRTRRAAGGHARACQKKKVYIRTILFIGNDAGGVTGSMQPGGAA